MPRLTSSPSLKNASLSSILRQAPSHVHSGGVAATPAQHGRWPTPIIRLCLGMRCHPLARIPEERHSLACRDGASARPPRWREHAREGDRRIGGFNVERLDSRHAIWHELRP